mgnify:CR=1 FL=1
MRIASALVLTLLLAGCQQPEPAEPEPAPPGFDAQAAYGFVAGLLTTTDGEPRARVPGTATHAEAADWLQAQMTFEGWDVARQSFTGAEYEALDHGSVASYRNSATYCQEPDDDEVAGLTFHNLIAQYGPKGKMLWLGAHWDSKEDASDGGVMLGANDGASGVGLLLQLMRHVPELDLPFGIGVVFFDGEDGFEDCHPLAGSLYFAQTMAPGLVDRFLLLDMVGDADARFVRETQSEASDPALVDVLWRHGATFAPAAFTSLQRQVVDDHVPFIEQGVPAVDLIDAGRDTFFPPYWHTSGDTLEVISVDMLGAVGNTLLHTLTDPAFVADWP